MIFGSYLGTTHGLISHTMVDIIHSMKVYNIWSARIFRSFFPTSVSYRLQRFTGATYAIPALVLAAIYYSRSSPLKKRIRREKGKGIILQERKI
ncbi:hypothetical protein Bca4012_046195 [Brassica carinata]|uniref:(rape) hypothetical protein n=1 Tax=Brassica napus TaxID=3708 RepID=A0A078F933_BRANA|nr:unnamed protein product [Brassica napus]CDY09896.1 BnaC09g42650D [Brassica napus]